MAEEPKPPFDSDATVSQPAPDPEATVALPLPDPEATVAGAPREPDPEATLSGPAAGPDPEATDRHPVFDPEATVNPAEQRGELDPEATFRIPRLGRKAKKNPFAPQARPESLQANMASLGGINPLVAMANPVLGVVPQIRHTLRLKDPSRLRGMLMGQLETFLDATIAAGVPEQASDAAAYALCALLDDSAAATPWGRDWAEGGMLQMTRGESGGGEGFFARLDEICAAPEANADLIEFYYVCLALGFEGRYRGAEGGRPTLAQALDRLYGLIAARRPRPVDGLSARWRTPKAQATVDAALQTAALVTAKLKAPAPSAEPPAEDTLPPRWSLARLPRRSIPTVVAGVAAVLLVGYLGVMRLMPEEAGAPPPQAPAPATAAPLPAAPAPAATPPSPAAPAPAVSAAPPDLLAALPAGAVAIARDGRRVTVRFRSSDEFAPGSATLNPALGPLVRRVARALDRMPGEILVTGHTDKTPIHSREFDSNQALSEARARAVAQLLAQSLADPQRVRAAGRADSAPLAAGSTPADRARNRRFEITLQTTP